MADARFLAIDLGAESGRGIVGTLVEGASRLQLEEVHRFPNGPLPLQGHLHWNALELYRQILEAIGLAARGGRLESIAVDTWGVDYALLGPGDQLLGAPYHYRDKRTQGVMEASWQTVSAEEIYRLTGIQFLPFNTLYQLIACRQQEPEVLAAARSLLMMGDFFTFLLTGEKVAELTLASTTQFLNAHTRQWESSLLEAFQLPVNILPSIVNSATVVGPLLPDLAERTGAGPLKVCATAAHDTGAAVAAVPGQGEDWCYISSGTWSLLGVEVSQPVITPLARRYDFTNEGGVGGTYRLLRNVMGLWLLQECRRSWVRAGDAVSYEELAAEAREAPPFRTLIDPDDRRFLAPKDMPEAIRDYARQTGQPEPRTRSEVVRCILESLAFKYRYLIEALEKVTGRPIRVIHVVGGGSRNQVLNQFTADAAGRTVLAGPVEATAMGNVLVQAMAFGILDGLAQIRSVVRASQPLTAYEPIDTSAWDDAYDRFLKLLGDD